MRRMSQSYGTKVPFRAGLLSYSGRTFVLFQPAFCAVRFADFRHAAAAEEDSVSWAALPQTAAYALDFEGERSRRRRCANFLIFPGRKRPAPPMSRAARMARQGAIRSAQNERPARLHEGRLQPARPVRKVRVLNGCRVEKVVDVDVALRSDAPDAEALREPQIHLVLAIPVERAGSINDTAAVPPAPELRFSDSGRVKGR